MSIADKITRLQNAKTDIAETITSKGGTVSAGDGFEEFADDIETIPAKYEAYEGSIDVTPTASDQVLETEQKSLESDITIRKVPTYETSNPAGGYTFTILS